MKKFKAMMVAVAMSLAMAFGGANTALADEQCMSPTEAVEQIDMLVEGDTVIAVVGDEFVGLSAALGVPSDGYSGVIIAVNDEFAAFAMVDPNGCVDELVAGSADFANKAVTVYNEMYGDGV